MENVMRRTLHNWLDAAAIAGTVLCAIHCLLLPLVLAATPLLSRWLDSGEGFHIGMLLFAVLSSAIVLHGGWLRRREPLPLILGATGLGLMVVGLRMPTMGLETLATLLGSVTLVSAHLLNWSSRRRCG